MRELGSWLLLERASEQGVWKRAWFLVYVIRAATMGRFLRFEMCHFKFIVNTVILSAIAVIMTIYGAIVWGIVAASALLLVSIVFNSRDVVRALKQVLSSMRNRRSGNVG